MEAVLTNITDYLWRQSWQIALLAVVVALASWTLRKRSAHVRYLLWLLVLAKCLAPPVVPVRLAVLPDQTPASIAPTAPAGRHEEPAVGPPVQERPLPAPSLVTPPPRLSMREWLALGWLAGATVFAGIAVAKAAGTIRWLHRERRPLPPKAQSSLSETFRSLHVKRSPGVWLVAGIGQPFVWGLLRGDIYLPQSFAQTGDNEHRRDILAHEISHVLRFDAAINSLQIVAQAIFWFHPLVWWANQRIRREREKCCDEMAIARLGVQPKDYGSAIIRTLLQAQESVRPVPSLAVAGPVKNIEERIRTMLTPGREFHRSPSLTAVTVAVLLALLTVPTALVLTARAQTKPAAEQKSTPAEPLHHAAAHGDVERVELLIAQGADVNATDKDGLTALYHAALRGQEDVAKLLTQKGARVNSVEPQYHFTPLHAATCNAHRNLVEFLLANGADANARDKGGYAPVIHALWNSDREMVGLLIGKGARVDMKDEGGWTAFRHAASQGSRDLIELFAAKDTDSPGLHLPACAGDLARLQRALGQRTNVDVKDEFDWTPLYWAACTGQTEVAEFLVSRGAEVNAKTKDGRTPLHQAAQAGAAKLVKLLVSKNADVVAKDKRGNAPIHSAASAEVVAILVAEGADVNTRGQCGRTPLHYAARYGRTAVAESLLQKGADVNVTDTVYGTALHYAALYGHPEVVGLLLARGTDVNAKGGKLGWTSLHGAGYAGRVQIVERLIAKGADVNARDKEGKTPLSLAKEQGHERIIELLCRQGAKE